MPRTKTDAVNIRTEHKIYFHLQENLYSGVNLH